MKLNSSRVLVSVLGFSFLLANHTFSFGAEKAPFYQGKTLNIVINFAAGGPTDIESRVLAKHLVKHIPGQPAITIQAMGGGGGVTAINYMGEVAKRDGFSAGYFTGSLFHHQTKERDPACRSQQVWLHHRHSCRHRLLHPRGRAAGNQEAMPI